ncbi:MAG: aminotransferase class V-fold PLP-dependent enzyme, partial [Bdellovibrionales bacterium]|nr:aminotransferase class V-fold PLP-dependent enzyme [Bdellovibrionales bacterium]
MNHIELGMTVRAKFPIFQKKCPLAYLDSAASAQKPYSVVQCMSDFYSYEHANIHRGAYELSALATERYEDARNKVAQFIGAEPNSVIFTRGATESINLVSYSLENYFSEGDVIILTELEHHSNIVPWQLLAERRRLK